MPVEFMECFEVADVFGSLGLVVRVGLNGTSLSQFAHIILNVPGYRWNGKRGAFSHDGGIPIDRN